jgi:hypothetical protein
MIMDDKEKQLSELRTPFLNLYNSAVATDESIKRLVADVKEIKDAQKATELRFDKIEKMLNGQNGDSEKKR